MHRDRTAEEGADQAVVSLARALASAWTNSSAAMLAALLAPSIKVITCHNLIIIS